MSDDQRDRAALRLACRGLNAAARLLTGRATALRARRAELAGEIEITTCRLQDLRAALRSLGKTLCLFDPDAVEPKVWRTRTMIGSCG